MKPKFPEQEKPSDGPEPTQPSWKTNIDLWSKLPVLVFLSLTIADYEVRRSRWEDWKQTDAVCFDYERYDINFPASVQSIFILILISMVSGFYITLKEKTKLTNIYRKVFTALGIFSVIYGIIMTGHRILKEIMYKGPFAPCPLNINADPWAYSQQFLIDSGTLTINVAIMVLLGGDPWTESEVDEEDNYLVRGFKKYSKGYFKCNLFVVFMSCVSILTNLINQIVFALPQYFGPEVFTVFGVEVISDRLIWIVTFLMISAFVNYKLFYRKKENNDGESSISDVTV